MVNDGFKHIEATALARILQELPPGARVVANSVGNLTVTDASLQMIGYIDLLLEGSYEPVVHQANAYPVVVLNMTNRHRKIEARRG